MKRFYYEDNLKLFNNKIVKALIMDFCKERLCLSRRESEIFLKVVCGASNKEICEECNIAEKTVKFHLTNIFKRTKVSRRSQLILSLPLEFLFTEDHELRKHLEKEEKKN